MIGNECRYEGEVLAAALEPGWPERADAQLIEHLHSCAVCADMASVASAIREESREIRSTARVPSAERVWWVAQLRARREASQAALRPMVATQTILCVAGIILFAACLVLYGSGLDLKLLLPTVSGIIAEHSLIAGGILVVICGAPAAVCLALRGE